jgi:hypothetical protein
LAFCVIFTTISRFERAKNKSRTVRVVSGHPPIGKNYTLHRLSPSKRRSIPTASFLPSRSCAAVAYRDTAVARVLPHAVRPSGSPAHRAQPDLCIRESPRTPISRLHPLDHFLDHQSLPIHSIKYLYEFGFCGHS